MCGSGKGGERLQSRDLAREVGSARKRLFLRSARARQQGKAGRESSSVTAHTASPSVGTGTHPAWLAAAALSVQAEGARGLRRGSGEDPLVLQPRSDAGLDVRRLLRVMVC